MALDGKEVGPSPRRAQLGREDRWAFIGFLLTPSSPPSPPGNFPPPTTPEELGARILIQERYEKFGESEEVEMEVESDEEDEKQEKTEEPPSQLDQDTQVQDMDEVCPWAWTGVR